MERFPDDARVCFVGDSITHRGLYIAHIASHYRKYFPDSKVEFYDCGISGGNLGNSIKVYGEDTALYEPTHVVLMIGVNDSRRNLLAEPPSKERYENLLLAYDNYNKNLETFYEMIKEKGAELILCTPVPLNEYRSEVCSAFRGGYALIQGYAEAVRNFAKKYDLPLCDYHTAITKAMQTEELYAPDGVHPTPDGHYRMAEAFLAAQGMKIEEDAALDGAVNEWYELTQKLRGVVATEYFMVKDYELADDERYEMVKSKLAEAEAGADFGVHTKYFTELMRDYMVNKPKQKEFVAKIKAIMKNQ